MSQEIAETTENTAEALAREIAATKLIRVNEARQLGLKHREAEQKRVDMKWQRAESPRRKIRKFRLSEIDAELSRLSVCRHETSVYHQQLVRQRDRVLRNTERKLRYPTYRTAMAGGTVEQ